MYSLAVGDIVETEYGVVEVLKVFYHDNSILAETEFGIEVIPFDKIKGIIKEL